MKIRELLKEGVDEIHSWLILNNKGLGVIKSDVLMAEKKYNSNPTEYNLLIFREILETAQDSIVTIINDEIWDHLSDNDYYDEAITEFYDYHEYLVQKLIDL